MSDLDKMRGYADRASQALLAIRPLGGSEMFTQVLGVPRADPEYCARLIHDLRNARHEAVAAKILAEREINRLSTELAQAREALDQYRAAVAKCLMEGCGNPSAWGDDIIAAQQNAAKFIQRPAALTPHNPDEAK